MATIITPSCIFADESCDLKEEKPTMLMMAEEKDEGMAADGDKDQEKEVTEENGRASEELEWEELRTQLFHILLELEETREVSRRFQEDYLELQGESTAVTFRVAECNQLTGCVCLGSRLDGGIRADTCCEAAVDEGVLISGQLEEERLLSAEQAETFSRQIQSLKGTSCPLPQT